MLINRLHRFLTAPTAKISRSQVIFWFSLSLTFAAIFGILGLQKAFCCEYVVHDDFRQHGFWMERFLDPELFPQDLIADYFQSAGPVGHTTLYRLLAAVGLNPLLLSKLLPVMLVLVGTGYCFGICLQMLPVPMAGFIATLLLNLNFWETADVASATPRAFAAPLLLAFLYYLLRRSLLPCLVVIALQGLFYPAIVLISAGIFIVRLLRWESGRLRLSSERNDYLFCATGLAIALLVLLPYELNSSGFGSTVTKAEMKTLPEFLPTGITSFDFNDPWQLWLFNTRSGIFRESPRRTLLSPQIWFGLLLPILLKQPFKFPLVRQITSSVTLLPQIGLASLGVFLAAHALLYKLFHPNRYMRFSLQILLALAAGIALTVVLDAVFNWLEQRGDRHHKQQFLVVGLTALIGTALVLYLGFLHDFPKSGLGYRVGVVPQLYEFFSQQPKDSIIASLGKKQTTYRRSLSGLFWLAKNLHSPTK
jgi:hypothetical protein